MCAVIVEHPEARLEILLRKSRQGNHEAFGDLVRAHEAMVYSILLRALRERVVAEELAQDIFLQLYRRLEQIESARHLTAWLRRVTTNRCIDELRKGRDKAVSLDEMTPIPESSEPHDHFLHDRLKNLVASLPEKQRLAVILRYQEGMEPGEISTMIDVPLNTVKSHLRRALATLRNHLGLRQPELETSPIQEQRP